MDPLIPGIVELTLEEGRAFFDKNARRLLGISGEEFLERWDNGEYIMDYIDPDHSAIMYLTMLIPFVR